MLRDDRVRWGAVPLLAAIVFVLLVALDLNGSSIALAGAGSGEGTSQGVIAGKPRPIRSDEWVVTTPLSVQAAEMDFPATPWVGLTETDVAIVVNTGASANWIEAFKPQDWGYFALGASRGLAWHWWFSFLICVAGAYLLFMQLTRSVKLAIAGTALLTFSPFTGWWSAPSTAMLIGFGALAAFFLIRAIQAVATRPRILCSLAGGLSAICLVAIAYPPWIIGTVYVVAALTIGILLDNWPGWKRAAGALIPGAVLAGLGAGLWAFTNLDAFKVFTSTYYPGQRKATAGTEDLSWLINAPTTFWPTLDSSLLTSSNLSQLATTWFPLPIVIAALAIAVIEIVQRRKLGDAPTTAIEDAANRIAPRIGPWTFGLLTIVCAIFALWAIWPAMNAVGGITLLNRVPAPRTTLAVGFASTLVILLAVAAARRLQSRTAAYVLLAVGVVVYAIMVAVSLGGLPLAAGKINPLLVAVSAAILGAAILLLFIDRLRSVGAALLTLYCVSAWIIVNPLMHGLGPLASDPIVVATRDYVAQRPDARMLAVDVAWSDVSPLLRAGGANVLSGTTYYPNPSAMNQLAPGQEAIWNNFQNYNWEYEKSANPIRLKDVSTTVTEAFINPCHPKARELLGITTLVTKEKIEAPGCLTLVKQFPRGTKQIYFYDVVPAS